MPGLSPKQMTIVRTLIDTAPDGVIRNLDRALASERLEGAMAQIGDLVETEAMDRLTRRLVFSPFVALCPVRPPAVAQKVFPAGVIALLWNALKAYAPDQASLAAAAARTWADDSDAPEVFNRLCVDAAQGLRHAAGTPFAAAATLLDQAEPDGAAVFASYLDLAPLARRTIAKLPDWLGRMTDERAVTIRLAYKDAVAVASDAGPRLFEILCAQLAEPWQILRIMSAVMTHPDDGYIAASELGYIGKRLLAEIERRMDTFMAFDPWAGAAAGLAAAQAVSGAIALITEFEQSVDLAKDGPWGSVILNHRRTLSGQVEKVMSKADEATAAALPLRSAKFGKGRAFPRYDNPPDARANARAQGLLAFISHARNAASAGGYASFRTKIMEGLDDRLDHYVEDVLDYLRDGESSDPERASAYLEVAANLVGVLRDEKAAQIVRRRAAA